MSISKGVAAYEADLATVDDAARLLERAYRRFEELRPTPLRSRVGLSGREAWGHS